MWTLDQVFNGLMGATAPMKNFNLCPLPQVEHVYNSLQRIGLGLNII